MYLWLNVIDLIPKHSYGQIPHYFLLSWRAEMLKTHCDQVHCIQILIFLHFVVIFSLTKVFLLTYYATYQSTTIPIEGVRFYPLVAGSFLSIFFFCCVATVTGLFIVCTMPGGKPSELLCGFGVLPLVRAVILAVLCAGFSTLLLGFLLRKPYTRLGHVSNCHALNSHIAHGMMLR